jgi:hypothetical protein
VLVVSMGSFVGHSGCGGEILIRSKIKRRRHTDHAPRTRTGWDLGHVRRDRLLLRERDPNGALPERTVELPPERGFT